MSDLAELTAAYILAVSAEAAAVAAEHAATDLMYEASVARCSAHHARADAEAALLAHLRGDGGVA